MSTTTNLSSLVINYLTQSQYDAAAQAGTLNENQIYLTPAVELAIVATSGSYNDLSNKPTIPNVPSWALQSSKPSYLLSEISGTDDLQSIEGLSGTSGLLKKTAANTWTLDTNTYLTSYTETDPTVPSWAKQPSKPTYTAAEVGALPDSTVIPSKVSDLMNDSGFITNAGVTGVKGDAESNYRTGNVTLTAANIGAVAKSDELQTTNPFTTPSLKGPYISKIDNAFYAADKRWTVTATNGGTVANLFDGSYETTFVVADGVTSVVTMDFSSSTYFPGYPYGYILVSVYYTARPASISCRAYCNYEPHGLGWFDIPLTMLSDSASAATVYRGRQGRYNISRIEFTITGQKTDTYNTMISQIEMHLDRPDSSRTPFLSKYGPETLYYTLTAPSFSGNLTGNVTGNVSGSAGSVAWSGVGSKPTTLSGYGITDAKIANGVITLGNNTITPLTSYTETDPVFTASAAAGITSTDISNWNAKVSDDKTWNNKSLLMISSLEAAAIYVPQFTSTSATSANVTKATSTPEDYAIAKYSYGAYLKSTTPSANDNSTKVATTAYVDAAIPKVYSSTNTGGYLTMATLPIYDGTVV